MLVNDPRDSIRAVELEEFVATDFATEEPVGAPTTTGAYPIIKRTVDFVVALSALLVLSPLMVLIAVAVLLDSSGPILFLQDRVGQHGRRFSMLKFRSMRAERRILKVDLPPGWPERRRLHKSMRDPRVTRVGRLLRRTCLDELPQLLNVLRGEMSLVGPRPELPSIVERYEPWQHERHAVKPGITGWWQVNRGADRLMHESTELDIYYVRHCSLWLDLRILAMTLLRVVRRDNVAVDTQAVETALDEERQPPTLSPGPAS